MAKPFLCGVYSPFKLASKFAAYWVKASNDRGHGVHSPFVFDFITHVLNDKKSYDCYAEIEALRRQLLADTTMLAVEDLGAGSRTGSTRQREVRSIARSALKPKKFGQLLHRIARYYQAGQVLELGTSLGITSSYLAAAGNTTLNTMEGAPAVAAVACSNFKKLGLQNIQLTVGNFDETLQPLLAAIKRTDIVFIDGNHREEPTLRYFKLLLPHCHNDSILIFDDVHWSAEMEQAWETIKADENVRLTIDLFFIGLVFFKKEFKVKQHFTIRF